MSQVVEKFPGWREAARRFMDGGPGFFISDEELAQIFREDVGSDGFRMQRMDLGIHLRRCGGQGLIRDREKRGYRLATDAEKVEILGMRELHAAAGALCRQRTYLSGVDVTQISSEQQRKRDHLLLNGAAIATMVERTRTALEPVSQGKLPEGDGEDE